MGVFRSFDESPVSRSCVVGALRAGTGSPVGLVVDGGGRMVVSVGSVLSVTVRFGGTGRESGRVGIVNEVVAGLVLAGILGCARWARVRWRAARVRRRRSAGCGSWGRDGRAVGRQLDEEGR